MVVEGVRGPWPSVTTRGPRVALDRGAGSEGQTRAGERDWVSPRDWGSEFRPLKEHPFGLLTSGWDLSMLSRSC